MALEPWLPKGHEVAQVGKVRLALEGDDLWQIAMLDTGETCLLVRDALLTRWTDVGLIERSAFVPIGPQAPDVFGLVSSQEHALCSLRGAPSPRNYAQAMSFAVCLRETRRLDGHSELSAALYVEAVSRLLPTFAAGSDGDDQMVLGRWLTGGLRISSADTLALQGSLSWLPASNIRAIIEAAGLPYSEPVSNPDDGCEQADGDIRGAPPRADVRSASRLAMGEKFVLPGRRSLAEFFNEHVIDILQNEDRYRTLGIGFPSAIILQGPPGCGKTFAVEQLVEFLDWPCFTIAASSVASPYIHETSRKIATVFDEAKARAPSVLIIDEMEAFLADRELGSGHHRIEEVAEFLRRIPDATSHRVLVFAMTNRVEMIDPAVIRRGRFDHIREVSFAGREEIGEMLAAVLARLPCDADVEIDTIAQTLVGRPLSDVAFIAREAGRFAAKAGKDSINMGDLVRAVDSAPAREREGGEKRRIGFAWGDRT